MKTPLRFALGLLLNLLLVSLSFAAAESEPAQVRDPQFKQAVDMVAAHQYAQAIPLLKAYVARVSDDADAYNYLGYATRKSGDLQGAFPYYERALKLNPRHRAVHEYIGEAYLLANNLPKAEEHLKILDGLCTFSCEEYRELKEAVAAYKARQVSAK